MSQYKKFINEVKDFPKTGIDFYDISPLLSNPEFFRKAIKEIAKQCSFEKIDKIISIESRGFLFAAPLALEMNTGLVMIRKPGKLPGVCHQMKHNSEYSESTLEIQEDSVKKGEKVLIIDDLLATGGTTLAAIKLVETLGAKVVRLGFLIEVEKFKAREKLTNYSTFSLIRYEK